MSQLVKTRSIVANGLEIKGFEGGAASASSLLGGAQAVLNIEIEAWVCTFAVWSALKDALRGLNGSSQRENSGQMSKKR